MTINRHSEEVVDGILKGAKDAEYGQRMLVQEKNMSDAEIMIHMGRYHDEQRCFEDKAMEERAG